MSSATGGSKNESRKDAQLRAKALLTPQGQLRSRQHDEYSKLCRELRIKPNSRVLENWKPTPTSIDEAIFHVYDFSENLLRNQQALPVMTAIAIDEDATAVLAPAQGFGDDAVVVMCECLKRCKALELVDVSGNRFSRRGANALVELARELPGLEVRTKDTCLNDDFINNRALPAEYTRLADQLDDAMYA
jgi:hypothetical protein